MKLLKNTYMVELFPDAEKFGHNLMKSTNNFNQMTSMNADQLEDVNNWILLFTSTFIPNNLYQTKHVTPYMHIVVSHIPQFIKLYGNNSHFSQQGLEKLNDEITKDYGTNLK